MLADCRHTRHRNRTYNLRIKNPPLCLVELAGRIQAEFYTAWKACQHQQMADGQAKGQASAWLRKPILCLDMIRKKAYSRCMEMEENKEKEQKKKSGAKTEGKPEERKKRSRLTPTQRINWGLLAATLILLGIAAYQVYLTNQQLKSTQEASERLIAQWDRLDTVMRDVSLSANELNVSLPIIVARIKASLGELSFTLENLQVNIDKSYELLMEAEQVQNEVTQNIHEAQKLIQSDIERKPLVTIVSHGVERKLVDSANIKDSMASINFQFVNWGDRTTEDARAIVDCLGGVRIVNATGNLRVLPDSQRFWLYYPGRLYWASPDDPYYSATDARVDVISLRGELDTIILKAKIFTAERRPYEHYFQAYPKTLDAWDSTGFIRREADSVRAREAAKSQ